MATMFPADVAAFSTPGEQQLFHFLERGARPDNLFLCWYSPDIEDREPDFILLSPDCGLVVFEVKDWLVSQIVELDPKTALLNTGGKQERRKQPLAQARGYVNNLMAMFCRKPFSPDDPKGVCPITWGAVFPHITREEFLAHKLDRVINAEKVLFWDELNENSPLTRDASGKTFRSWLLAHFPPLFPFTLSPAKIDWLRGMIFPIARLNLPVRNASAQSEVTKVLDHEQENLARTFGPGKTLLLGPSGSGKTIILAHQAWHLPRVDKGIRRILITCFNLSLVGYIRRLLAKKGVSMGAGGVEVIPFYSLCERVLGENLAHSDEEEDYYRLIVRESLERLAKDHPLKGCWDAILVDEGQDFNGEMLDVLFALLPEGGTFFMVEDENQRLYHAREEADPQKRLADFRSRRLTRQYRNTRQIASFAMQLLDEMPDGIDLGGATGAAPAWIRSGDGLAQVEAIADAVAALAQKSSMSEIAVLYAKSKIPGVDNLPSALLAALEARGVLGRWAAKNAESKRNYDITTDSVTISTIHSAKGLDFAHVILAGLDLLPADDEYARRLAYVGLTRARETLTIAVCGEKGLAAELQKKTQRK